MNTVQLQCFVSVADTLSFSSAAKILNLTQPSVTYQIQSLESELEVKLFHRSPKGVELTENGKDFLKSAREILYIANTSKKKMQGSPTNTEDILVIGGHSNAELNQTTNILYCLKESFPNSHPIFHLYPFPELFNSLDNDTVDIIVTFCDEKKQTRSRKYQEFLKLPITALVPNFHPYAQKKVLTLEELLKVPVILTTPKGSPSEYSRIFNTVRDTSPNSTIYICDNIESSYMLAKAGYGIAILPELPIWEDSSIKYIPLQGFSPISFGAYYKNTGNKPILKHFLEIGCRPELWLSKTGIMPSSSRKENILNCNNSPLNAAT